MYKMIKRWVAAVTIAAVFLSGIFLAEAPSSPVSAAPDVSVSNKQNFSTDVIYQIFTDRFLDGDPSNNPSGSAYDGSCTNLKLYCGGDWQGIIDKINADYFTHMGITALWITPPYENIYSVINYSGVNNTSYHGYWGRDFKKTNPFFGSMTDFQNLIASAHAKGIKIIIDFAPNHTSPAMETDPSFAENGKLYDNGTLMGGYTGDTNGYFHHNGGTDFTTTENDIYKNMYDLVDINHNNSTIDAYFKEAIKMWLDLGIDGIRVDAVKHMPLGWQKNFMSYINGYKPVFTFGEWYLGSSAANADNTMFANESGMSLMDYRFAHKVRQVFRDNTDTMYGLDAMLSATSSDYNFPADQVTFIDNHDVDRFKTSSVNNRMVEQALALTLTSRGAPSIYYGTEQYMSGLNEPGNRARISSFSETSDAFKTIQALAPLRKSNPAIAYGTTQQRWINNDVYIYERKLGSSVAVVAINRNLSSSASITGLTTSLPSGNYTDVLKGLLAGNNITSNNGSIPNFTLAAGAVAVWQYTTTQTAPVIGHVGPTMEKPGDTVTIDGRGFGSAKGTVYFGSTTVTGADIVSWEDSQIKAIVPSVPAGKYSVKVQTSSSIYSNSYNNFNVLTDRQVTVRFVVQNATTSLGEQVYVTGNVSELGNWAPDQAIGPMYNQVLYSYPTWYFDVSVPAGTPLQFKFLKKKGSTVTWEAGDNHSFTTPANGTATVTVNWQ